MLNYIRNKSIYLIKQHDLLKIIFILTIISYYLFVFIQQIATILDVSLLHEELRQLFPYYQKNDPRLFNGDYITSYYTSSNQPYLYDWLTRFWLFCDGSLVQFHHIMPIILWILLLASAAIAGWRLQGFIGSLGAFGLVLTQPLFLYQITSAIPHAFAFSLLGWTIVALLYENILGLVVLTLLSSVLYPPVTPIIGLSLGGYLISFYKDELKKFSPSIIIRTIAIVGSTGCLSIILGSAVLQPKEGFGEPLALFQEIEEFPENGFEGRSFIGVTEPQFYIVSKFLDQFNEAVGESGGVIVLLLIYLSVVSQGLVSYIQNSQYQKGLGIFIIVNIIVVSLVFIFKPFYIYRFFFYPFAILFSVLMPLGVVKLFSFFKNTKKSFYLSMLFLFIFTLTLDGYNQKKIGYSSVIDTESYKVLDFVQTLPTNTLIAGWPTNALKGNLTEIIPYIAKHRVLIQGKAHYPTHKGYLIEMRKKMYSFIDAYSASNGKAINKLKDDYNVSYLLVDKRHFSKKTPIYFAPFKNYIKNIWASRKKGEFLLNNSELQGKVFETENYYILNINDFLATN